MMWLFGLIVISAIIDRHGSDCSLTAKIFGALGTNECPRSCSCKWELQKTTFDCSIIIERRSEKDWNSNIQEIFDPFIENITYFRISHEPKMDRVPENNMHNAPIGRIGFEPKRNNKIVDWMFQKTGSPALVGYRSQQNHRTKERNI